MVRDDSPDLRYVADLIQACQKIIRFTDGYVEADFVKTNWFGLRSRTK